MPFNDVLKLYESLEALEARDRLFLLNCSDYSGNMTKDSRKALYKEVKSKARFVQKTMTAAEIVKVLKNE